MVVGIVRSKGSRLIVIDPNSWQRCQKRTWYKGDASHFVGFSLPLGGGGRGGGMKWKPVKESMHGIRRIS